jgi:flagellar biosynthetic protein FliR
MTWTAEPGALAAGVLVAARMAGVVTTMPGLGGAGVPGLVRAALALALALAAAPAAPAVAADLTLFRLLLAAGREVLVGAALGWVAQLVVGAAEAAGELVGLGMGLGLSATLDPISGHAATSLGLLHRWLALALFFALDGHHTLLLAAVGSVRALPPGQAWFGPGAVEVLAAALGRLVLVGLAMAAPALAGLFLIQLVLVVVGRSVPQLQLLTVAWPATIATGLVLLALTAGPAGAHLAGAVHELVPTLGRLLRALGGG